MQIKSHVFEAKLRLSETCVQIEYVSSLLCGTRDDRTLGRGTEQS